MSKIKLVLTDIDGTLVPSGKHEVSEQVREAVIAAENAGIKVVPVTGRPYELAVGLMNVLGLDWLCVLDGGATIRRVATGELMWSKWLEPAVLKQIVPIILPHCTVMDYSPGRDVRTPDQADAAAITESAPYVMGAVHTDSVPGIQAALQHIPDVVAHVSNFDDADPAVLQFVQVTHIAADKQHGVDALMHLLKFSIESVLGIGDGGNDLPLFRSAGLKVAMGNASDELKAAADHIVADVSHDGFAEAIEKFVLQK